MIDALPKYMKTTYELKEVSVVVYENIVVPNYFGLSASRIQGHEYRYFRNCGASGRESNRTSKSKHCVDVPKL